MPLLFCVMYIAYQLRLFSFFAHKRFAAFNAPPTSSSQLQMWQHWPSPVTGQPSSSRALNLPLRRGSSRSAIRQMLIGRENLSLRLQVPSVCHGCSFPLCCVFHSGNKQMRISWMNPSIFALFLKRACWLCFPPVCFRSWTLGRGVSGAVGGEVVVGRPWRQGD